MKWNLNPRIGLLVCGDWRTVISVRDYSDYLLDQKPYDEMDAEYDTYRLYLPTARQIVDAYKAFTEKRLKCEIIAACDADDRTVNAYIATGDGWGGKEPYAQVNVRDELVNAKLASRIEAARKALMADDPPIG